MPRKKPAGNYIAAQTPRVLTNGDTLTYTLAFPDSPTPYTYTYTNTTNATTFYGGWWQQPATGQAPVWAPDVGTDPNHPYPSTRPSDIRWLTPDAPPPPTPISEEVKKQIEDAKLSPHAALVGYRAWAVDLDNTEGPMLKSVVTGTIWPYRKELRAHRLRNDWDTPNGIHAARSMEHLMDNAYLATSKVCGEVYLWGRVIHGEIGYRAEYAYPKVLRSRHDYWWLKELANRYGIPYEVA